MLTKATKRTLDRDAPKGKSKPPFRFVLEELESIRPWTRPMFGCTAIYVQDRIMFILRCKEPQSKDNGVWLATSEEHHSSLKREFPSMRSIELFGEGPTSWQVLPEMSEDFEDAVLRACQLVLRGDPRIGRLPKTKNKRKRLEKSP